MGILRLPVGVGLVVAFFIGSWNTLKANIFPDEVSVMKEFPMSLWSKIEKNTHKIAIQSFIVPRTRERAK